MLRSDHAPILTILNSNRRPTNKPFRFENWWLAEQDYQTVAQTSWRHSVSRTFAQKTKYLAADLRSWRRKKPKLSDQLAQVEDQLLQEQSKPPQQQDFTLQEQLTEQHHQLLSKNEQFHLQRAKKNWALLGDRNTSFFHLSITKRSRKNRIAYLQNLDGSHSTTQEQLAATLLAYFHSIYNVNNLNTSDTDIFDSQLDIVQEDNQTHVSPPNYNILAGHEVQIQTDLTYTNSIPDDTELHNIIKEMRNNASPGPDGLNALFYESSWTWISQDVCNLVTTFYSTATLQPEINHTFLVLIPKKTTAYPASGLQTHQLV